MLVFGISISKISNVQSAEKCWEYLQIFWNKVVRTNGIGAVFLYSDYLYMYTEQGSPAELRAKYLETMLQHKNALLNILEKNPQWIQKSFTFLTWGQLLLNTRRFTHYFAQLRKMYDEDKVFQQHVAADAAERGISEGQVNFLLEESLVFYLISKGQIAFDNEYIQHREQWILNCYPGKPLRTETYLYQKNFFDLDNSKNQYQSSFYDLDGKVLYDLSKI